MTMRRRITMITYNNYKTDSYYYTVKDLIGDDFFDVYVLHFTDHYNHTPNIKSLYERKIGMSDLPDWLASAEAPNFNYYQHIFRMFLVNSLQPDVYFAYPLTKTVPAWEQTIEPTSEEITNFYYSAWVSFFNKLYQTGEIYIPLIKSAEANLEQVKNGVAASSTTVSRFNDTPQDEGTFDSDEHTTNITQQSTESNISAADRMLQYEELLKNYYDRWVAEFKLFLVFLPNWQ